MNATGLRDQRLRLYARTDQGTDGFVRATFDFSGEWWGRVDEGGGSVQMMQERLQRKIDAVAEFADEAMVPDGGVLKDLLTGQCWWIRSIYSNRMLRRVFVALEVMSTDQFATTSLYEDASVLDGTHLVDPS